MTAFSLPADARRRERASFVPTAFFAEFLAGAREGLESDARYHALPRKSAPNLAKFGTTDGPLTTDHSRPLKAA